MKRRVPAFEAEPLLGCQVPGHEHVVTAESNMGYALPFCAPHVDALPQTIINRLFVVAGASVFQFGSHAEANEATRLALRFFSKLKKPVRGICRVCFCTDEAGCEDGCSWVDKAHTLCTRCEALRVELKGQRR